MRTQIPDASLDLVNDPSVAALTTVMPDGQPQTTVVWCNFDGRHVLVNTMRGFHKEQNMRLNPRVTLLCYDPRQPLRSLEVRGRVEMTEEGALEHLDQLTRCYTHHPHYYGSVYPLEQRARETRHPAVYVGSRRPCPVLARFKMFLAVLISRSTT